MAANRGLLVLAVLIAVIAIGTLGYNQIEGYSLIDGAYMTVITITTVGYGEVHPLSDEGKLFTMALIIVGVAVAVFAITVFGEWMIHTMLRTQRVVLRNRLSDDELVGEAGEHENIFESVRGGDTNIAQVVIAQKSPLAGHTKVGILRKTGVVILAAETKNANRFDVDFPFDRKVEGSLKYLVLGNRKHLEVFEKMARARGK